MDKKIIEAFDVCVRALETGADMESVLKLYPDLAEELHPLLQTADRALMMALAEVPQDAMKRGRNKILRHADALRVTSAQKSKSALIFRRWATSLVLAIIFFLGGTGVVNASSGTLPGDNLYLVKRVWEEVRLWFEFSPAGREVLESEYEQERLDEIGELLTEGREETIEFSGIVTAMGESHWIISDVPVKVTADTKLPIQKISIGAPVIVTGRTNVGGFIQVQAMSLLEPGASLPPFESEELEKHEDENSSDDDGNDEPRTFKFQGVVTLQQGNTWMINGQRVNVGRAEIKGDIAPGDFVEFEGYYDENRQFIVIRMELKVFSQGPSENENLNTNSGGDEPDNDNDDDDSDNNNKNDEDGDNTNNSNDDDNDNDNDNTNNDDKDREDDSDNNSNINDDD